MDKDSVKKGPFLAKWCVVINIPLMIALAACLQQSTNRDFLDHYGILIQDIMKILTIIEYLSSILTLFYGYFADNFFDPLSSAVLSLMCAVAAPVFTLLTAVNMLHNKQKYMFLLSFLMCVPIMSSVYVVRILQWEQFKLPSEKQICIRYMVLLESTKYVGAIVTNLIVMTSNFVPVYIGFLILNIVFVILNILFYTFTLKYIRQAARNWRGVDIHGIYALNKLKKKILSKSNTSSTIPLPKYLPDKAVIIAKGNVQRALSLLVLFLVLIPYSAGYNRLYYALIYSHGLLLSRSFLLSSYFVLPIVMIVTLFIGEFVAFPLARFFEFQLTTLKVIGIGFAFLPLGLFFCTCLEYAIYAHTGRMPVKYEADVRLYNMLPHLSIIESDWFSHSVNPYSSVMVIYPFYKKNMTYLNITCNDLKMNTTVNPVFGESRSYIISESGVKELIMMDPIHNGTNGTNDPFKARLFMISSLEASDIVKYIIVQKNGTEIEIDNMNDSTIVSLHEGYYSINVLSKNETQKFMSYYFDSGAVYTLLFFKNTQNTYGFKIFNILRKPKISFFWILPEMICFAVYESSFRIIVMFFVLLETPVPIRSTFISLIWLLYKDGIGVQIFFDWYFRPSPLDYIFYCGLSFAALVIYVCISYGYKSRKVSKYLC